MSLPIQLGCCSEAPRWPQTAQRSRSRITWLEAAAPQRMTNGASARGAECMHGWPVRSWPGHLAQTHGVVFCRAPKVGTGPGAPVAGAVVDLLVCADCAWFDLQEANPKRPR